MTEATFWFTTVITVIILMIPVLAWRFYFVDACPTLSDRVRLKQRLAQLRYVQSLLFVPCSAKIRKKVPLLIHIFLQCWLLKCWTQLPSEAETNCQHWQEKCCSCLTVTYSYSNYFANIWSEKSWHVVSLYSTCLVIHRIQIVFDSNKRGLLKCNLKNSIAWLASAGAQWYM